MRLVLSEQGVSLPMADLLHAATARESGITFVTRDVEDFDTEPLRQLMQIEFIR